VASEDLVDRLIEAGFTASSLPALSLAPLSAVAWASGVVTEEEGQKALLSIFDSQVIGNGAAVEQFRSWLKRRPPAGLMDLWEDFTRARVAVTDETTRQQQGRLLRDQAVAIGLASGGVLGFGAICTEEQAVISRIELVYSLSE
jgi:hypothetical protein